MVSVSQSFNLQPDLVVFGIYVTTPASTGLDEVVAPLKNVGITASNFSSVTSARDHPDLTWLFTLAVPFSKLAATATQLTTQKVGFFVQGSQAHQAQQCSLPTLMAAARVQAKQLAHSPDLVVGHFLTLSPGTPST